MFQLESHVCAFATLLPEKNISLQHIIFEELGQCRKECCLHSIPLAAAIAFLCSKIFAAIEDTYDTGYYFVLLKAEEKLSFQTIVPLFPAKII